jgi:glycosyltransferase involved in cell wall biosynthesis
VDKNMNEELNNLPQDIPSITVLMSVFNSARWLSEAIESVLNQTFRDFEFIIVDDGSTDNSYKIIKQYQSLDPRIIIISKPNTGLADSLNQGIMKARGKWIARLDADDICETTRLEKQIERAQSNSKLVFIGTGATIIDEFGRKLKTYTYPENHIFLQKNLRTARKFPPHSSAMYKTSVFKKLGGYRGRISLAEDADLWLRLSEIGQLTCLNGPYVQIRTHTGQITHTENGMRQQLDARLATVASWVRHFGFPDPIAANEKDYQDYHNWLLDRLNEDGLIEFLSHKAKIHFQLGIASQSSFALFDLMKISLKSPIHTIRYIKEKFIGESLPRHLAINWIKEHKKID